MYAFILINVNINVAVNLAILYGLSSYLSIATIVCIVIHVDDQWTKSNKKLGMPLLTFRSCEVKRHYEQNYFFLEGTSLQEKNDHRL